MMATVDPEMGVNKNSDTAGFLLCLAGWQSPSCTAGEEDFGLADGFGETTNVQLENWSWNWRSDSPSIEGRAAFSFCMRRLIYQCFSLITGNYRFFIRLAKARFSCTVNSLKVRHALGHSGVGIIILS